MIGRHLVLQAGILLLAQARLPVLPAIDNRPRRARRIVQQRLGPARRRIMHVKRHRRRLHRRQPVMIVLRVKALDMTNRQGPIAQIKPVLAPAHRILIGNGPPIRTRHNRHPVGPQHMQLHGQHILAPHGLQIPVPAEQQLTIQGLEQLCPPLRPVGPRDQVQNGMHVIAAHLILTHQRQSRRRLGNQLHRPKPDRIGTEPALGQRHRIARAPCHTPHLPPRHDRPGRTGLFLGHVRRRAPKHRPNHVLAPFPSDTA